MSKTSKDVTGVPLERCPEIAFTIAVAKAINKIFDSNCRYTSGASLKSSSCLRKKRAVLQSQSHNKVRHRALTIINKEWNAEASIHPVSANFEYK
jgi:hypothetical protein